MITFEQAKHIAKKIVPRVDTYQEYPDAFVFFIEQPKKDEVWDNEVVIRKSDGKLISYVHYIMVSKYADNSVVNRKL